MGEFVRVEVADGIATIRLDRPKMNALNAQVQDEIAAAAAQVSADDAVRAVILYGGERVFAAGADIKEMAALGYRGDGRAVGRAAGVVQRRRGHPQAGRRGRHRVRARRRA